MDETGLMQFLDQRHSPYRRYEHPAVYPVAEVDALGMEIPGAGNKNLFLQNENKTPSQSPSASRTGRSKTAA